MLGGRVDHIIWRKLTLCGIITNTSNLMYSILEAIFVSRFIRLFVDTIIFASVLPLVFHTAIFFCQHVLDTFNYFPATALLCIDCLSWQSDCALCNKYIHHDIEGSSTPHFVGQKWLNTPCAPALTSKYQHKDRPREEKLLFPGSRSLEHWSEEIRSLEHCTRGNKKPGTLYQRK